MGLDTKIESIHPIAIWCGLIFVIGTVLIPMACMRPIDGEEAYYLMASRLVMEGKVHAEAWQTLVRRMTDARTLRGADSGSLLP